MCLLIAFPAQSFCCSWFLQMHLLAAWCCPYELHETFHTFWISLLFLLILTGKTKNILKCYELKCKIKQTRPVCQETGNEECDILYSLKSHMSAAMRCKYSICLIQFKASFWVTDAFAQIESYNAESFYFQCSLTTGTSVKYSRCCLEQKILCNQVSICFLHLLLSTQNAISFQQEEDNLFHLQVHSSLAP
jgi:hypothetical protein